MSDQEEHQADGHAAGPDMVAAETDEPGAEALVDGEAALGRRDSGGREGDGADARLDRVRDLLKENKGGLEGAVALARAAIRAQRWDMARDALSDVKNVTVEGFSGLLMNFVQEHDARVVMRGVRAVSDFDYEFQMAGMNRHLMPDVETVFLTPSDKYQFISSTFVREIATLGGEVDKFVSPVVNERLMEKVRGSART